MVGTPGLQMWVLSLPFSPDWGGGEDSEDHPLDTDVEDEEPSKEQKSSLAESTQKETLSLA